jgi:hypothetical protein
MQKKALVSDRSIVPIQKNSLFLKNVQKPFHFKFRFLDKIIPVYRTSKSNRIYTANIYIYIRKNIY